MGPICFLILNSQGLVFLRCFLRLLSAYDCLKVLIMNDEILEQETSPVRGGSPLPLNQNVRLP